VLSFQVRSCGFKSHHPLQFKKGKIILYIHVGLTQEGEEFVKYNANFITSPTGLRPEIIDIECIKFSENNDSIINLKTYKLKDGNLAREVIQLQCGCQDEYGFICLEVKGKLISKWVHDPECECEFDCWRGVFNI
jgi:hypothetical protein